MNDAERGRLCPNAEEETIPSAEIKTAQVLFFPRHRIVRVILKGNRVYNPPGPRYPEWDNAG